MAPRLTILDLDRTLFQTNRFLADLLVLLSAHYHLDPPAFQAQMPDYGTGELYDFYRQLAAMLGLTAPGFEQLALTELPIQDYLYPDVAPWLAQRPADETILIMTMGLPEFQHLKLRFAPALAKLPRLVVQRNKGLVLKDELAPDGQGGWSLAAHPGTYRAIRLVDDNTATHAALGPHPAVTAYHLARPEEPYTRRRTPAHAQRISGLVDLD